MSGCTHCGKARTTNRYSRELNMKTDIESSDEHIDGRSSVFDEMNKYSLSGLISMKAEVQGQEFKKFMDGMRLMSEDVKIFQVMSFLSIINGDEFSITGQSPEYLITLLHKILAMPEMAVVNEKYPLLREKIDERYKIINNSKILLE
jgi:hypothetical protein